MAREGQIQGFTACPIYVPAGISNAVSFGFSSQAFYGNAIVKYGSGGSLEIIGTSPAVLGGGYLMGTTESVTVGGPAQFWLCATGATATAFVLQGRTVFPGQS